MEAGSALIGRTLAGRFRITGAIGEGAMATVFRGEQDAVPREVAIKVMHPHLSRDPIIVRRFKREAKAAALLKHPNTVRIFAYGFESSMAYMVMELLKGRDLFQVIADDGPMPELRAVRILFEVCRALQAAHGRGIIHRDLKPENVMVIDDPRAVLGERVKVLDFGIAKVLEPVYMEDQTHVTSTALTSVGSVVGTPEYMSPEQCQGIAIDARSDIYACGALLYKLLTGKPPFEDGDPVGLMLKQVRQKPVPPSATLPRIHRGVEALIMRALSKKPDGRPQSAVDLRAELSDLYADLGGDAAAPGAVRAVAEASSSRLVVAPGLRPFSAPPRPPLTGPPRAPLTGPPSARPPASVAPPPLPQPISSVPPPMDAERSSAPPGEPAWTAVPPPPPTQRMSSPPPAAPPVARPRYEPTTTVMQQAPAAPRAPARPTFGAPPADPAPPHAPEPASWGAAQRAAPEPVSWGAAQPAAPEPVSWGAAQPAAPRFGTPPALAPMQTQPAPSPPWEATPDGLADPRTGSLPPRWMLFAFMAVVSLVSGVIALAYVIWIG